MLMMPAPQPKALHGRVAGTVALYHRMSSRPVIQMGLSEVWRKKPGGRA